MADTETAERETVSTTPDNEDTERGEYVVHTAQDEAAEPAAEPRSGRRGRPRAVPLIIHGVNVTGIGVGALYTAVGMPGLAAAGLAGAAVGAACLVGRRRRTASAARRSASGSNRSAGTGTRRHGGRGHRGGLGGGRSLTGRGGRGNRAGAGGGTSSGGRPSSGSGGGAGRRRKDRKPSAPGGTGSSTRGPGRGTSGSGSRGGSGGASGGAGSGASKGPAGSRSGKAWQTLRGWANKARRRGAGGGTPGSGFGNSGSGAPGGGSAGGSTPTPTSPGRGRRLLQRLRGAATRLRQRIARTTRGNGTPANQADGRLYLLRRRLARRIAHWARCAGAGTLAALGGLATLPVGFLWGVLRLLTNHRDPLGGFAFPVRIAGRIWRFFFRRSRARHDNDAQADALNLNVNDPRKDSDPVTGTSIAPGATALDGQNSKFALSMKAAADGYYGFKPTSMMHVAAEYAGLPNGIRAVAATVQSTAVIGDQTLPLSKRVVQKLSEAYAEALLAAKTADDMVTQFRTLHHFDIQRILNPRTNEWMWNVTPTGGEGAETAMFQPGRIEAGCVLTAVLYRSYQPVHMMQRGSEIEGMGYGLKFLADAVDALRNRTNAFYPVDDRVTDDIGRVTTRLQTAAQHAEMAGKLFLEDHSREISHNTHPRKGPAAEGMWNAPR